MPTLRTQLSRNRRDNFGAAIVGGIGKGLSNYAAQRNTQKELDLQQKARDIQQQQTDQQAKRDQAEEQYRNRMAANEEAKVNAIAGKSVREQQSRDEAAKSAKALLDAMVDQYHPKAIKAARTILTLQGGKVEPDKLMENISKALNDDYEKKDGEAKGAGGVTKNEALLRAQGQIANETAGVNAQLAPLKDKAEQEQKLTADMKPAGDLAGSGKTYDKARNTLMYGTPESPGLIPNRMSTEGLPALADTIYNNIPRLKTAVSTLQTTPASQRFEEPKGLMAGMKAANFPPVGGASVASPTQGVAQVEPETSPQDDLSSKAIVWLQRVAATGKTIDDVLADYKANQAVYEAKGITEKMIYDVLGKAQ